MITAATTMTRRAKLKRHRVNYPEYVKLYHNTLFAKKTNGITLSRSNYAIKLDGVIYPNINLASNRYIGRISKRYIYEHINCKETYYYSNQFRVNDDNTVSTLICIDIDAHNGAKDALQLANVIYLLLKRKAYVEQSTNGKGIHLYFHAKYQIPDIYYVDGKCILSKKRLNKYYSELIRELKLYIESRYRFDAKIDNRFFGSYRITKQGEEQQSQWIKLPRANATYAYNSVESLYSLNDTPVHVNALKRYLKLSNEELLAEVANLIVDEDESENNDNSDDASINYEERRNHPDGNLRKLYSICEYSRTKGRLPTIDEALDYYEAHYATTGERDRARVSKMQDALAFVSQSYCNRQIGNYKAGDYLPLFNKLFGEGYRETVNRCIISNHDYDCLLGLVVKSERNNSEMSRASVIAWFEHMREESKEIRPMTNHKYAYMIKQLIGNGIIEVVKDAIKPTWTTDENRKWVKTPGKGRKYRVTIDISAY